MATTVTWIGSPRRRPCGPLRGVEKVDAWVTQQEEALLPRTRLRTERRVPREDDHPIFWNTRMLRFAAHDVEAAGDAVHVAVVAG